MSHNVVFNRALHKKKSLKRFKFGQFTVIELCNSKTTKTIIKISLKVNK